MKTCKALTVIIVLSFALGAAAGDPERPNIVLIIADDLGYGEVGCYPQTFSTPVRTPHLDRLAEGGVRMTNAYSAHPMCWPSRASILTGRYYQRFLRGTVVPETERMIGSYLKRSGYATACIGKWHNTGSIGAWDGRPENIPIGRGFDEFFGFLGGMHDYFKTNVGTHWLLGKNRPYYMPVYNGTQPVTETKYLTDEFTERAVDFIERHAQHPWPFFLYLSYTAIHSPDQAPESYLSRNDGDVHRAMIDALDTGIGRVVEALEKNNVRENTLILFVGDNGGYRDNSNWKLTGQKGQWFEGGIRVPFIANWPGRLDKGQACSSPVMHIDILPTLLAAVGQKIPRNLDGKNLLDCWRRPDAPDPHDALFWSKTDGSRYAVRKGDWKLIQESDRKRETPTLRLYNLEDDPTESNNLITQEKAMADQLKSFYRAWCRKIK